MGSPSMVEAGRVPPATVPNPWTALTARKTVVDARRMRREADGNGRVGLLGHGVGLARRTRAGSVAESGTVQCVELEGDVLDMVMGTEVPSGVSCRGVWTAPVGTDPIRAEGSG
jgi:hypothetical protein